MTRSNLLALWIVVVLISSLSLGWSARRLFLTSRDAQLRLNEAKIAVESSRELVNLTRVWPSHISLQRPEIGLSPQITQMLAQVGLPASTLSSFQPGTESMLVRDAAFQVFSIQATMSFDSLTLPQLGKFLSLWRSAQPSWIVCSIDLSPLPAGSRSGSPTPASIPNTTGFDAPIKATILIKNQFVQSSPVASPQPTSGSTVPSSTPKSSAPPASNHSQTLPNTPKPTRLPQPSPTRQTPVPSRPAP